MAKTKKKRSPAVRRIRRMVGTFFRMVATVVMVCVITGCICACALTVYMMDYIGTLEDIDITNIDMNYTSILYANNAQGEPYEISRIHGGENRILVEYESMPKVLLDATVAAEDKRFWEHDGVDWKRTAIAAVNFFLPFLPAQGGSTITQQLIKNATDQWDPNVERKVREIFSALKLNKDYTREQILEAYLNVAAFGHNTNGIEAAANYYFNKNTKDLTLLESATIVAITKAPSYYDPIKNPGNNKSRRQYIFTTMLEMGTITQQDYDAIYKADVAIDASQMLSPAQQPNSKNSWIEDQVIEEVIEDLQSERGMEHAEANKLLMRGGLQIYTTIDEEMQTKLEQMYIYADNPESIFPKIKNTIYPESAFIVTDLHGKVKAIAGSDRPKQGNRWLNYATQVPRQPGSTMKPISAYLQGIEKDYIRWSTVFSDSPIQKPGTSLEKDGFIEWPRNYYEGYSGPNTCVMALQRSINTIAVKIVNLVGPEVSLRFLHDKVGLESLVTPEENAEVNDNNLSAMALGGTTEGVTLLELAGAYQMNANGGTYTKPTTYTIVKDRDGNTILESDTMHKRVITRETSTIMNKMMQQVVVGPRGTGSTAKFTGDLAGMPIAGKTGTSNDNFDQWFVGITPHYIGITWMGYAPKRQPINYISFPTPIIWHNVMQPLHEGLEVKDFEYSPNVVEKAYCAESGDLASDSCPGRLNGWYKATNIPDVCMDHTGVQVSELADELSSKRDDEDEDSSSRIKKPRIRTRSSSSSRD